MLARYLSASEAAWRIFGFRVKQREPSVSCLPIHLLGRDQVIFEEGGEQIALDTTISMQSWNQIDQVCLLGHF